MRDCLRMVGPAHVGRGSAGERVLLATEAFNVSNGSITPPGIRWPALLHLEVAVADSRDPVACDRHCSCRSAAESQSPVKTRKSVAPGWPSAEMPAAVSEGFAEFPD